MQANSPSSPSIDMILGSGHVSTITRNLAFPLRTTVLVFCEGPATEDPPRVSRRGDFRNPPDLTYVADDDLEGEAQSISDASDSNDLGLKGGQCKTRFLSILNRLRAMICRLAHPN